MLLLELQDDDHDLLWAFGLWALAVGCLMMWSKYLQRRDQRIAAEAAGPVHLVREQLQRQRSRSEVDGEGAPSRAANESGSAAAAAGAAPGAREDWSDNAADTDAQQRRTPNGRCCNSEMLYDERTMMQLQEAQQVDAKG